MIKLKKMNSLSKLPGEEISLEKVKRSQEGKMRCISNHRDKPPMSCVPPHAVQEQPSYLYMIEYTKILSKLPESI